MALAMCVHRNGWQRFINPADRNLALIMLLIATKIFHIQFHP